MAKKNTSMEIYDVPATLQEHPFYGLRLDEYQKVFSGCYLGHGEADCVLQC